MAGRLKKPAFALAGLAVAMAASAALVLSLGSDLALNGDEIFYFAHFVIRDGAVTSLHGVEYFFAPHNGHLVLGGRLIFELLFRVAGTDYLVFRLAEVIGILVAVAVGVFFALVRRRAGPAIALERAGGAVFVPMAAGPYFEGEDRYGPLGFSLDRIREESPTVRDVADATLVAGLDLSLHTTAPPAGLRARPVAGGRQHPGLRLPAALSAGAAYLRPITRNCLPSSRQASGVRR